jgi:hypothetical protein
MKTRQLLSAALVALALPSAGCSTRGVPVYNPTVPDTADDDVEASRIFRERQYCADLANYEHARLERWQATNRAYGFTSVGLLAGGAAVLVGNEVASESSDAARVVGTSLLFASAAAFGGWLVNRYASKPTKVGLIEWHLYAARSEGASVPCTPGKPPYH